MCARISSGLIDPRLLEASDRSGRIHVHYSHRICMWAYLTRRLRC